VKVAVIGAGNLGMALIKNAMKNTEIIAVRRRIEKAQEMKGVEFANEIEGASEANIFLVALKPHVFRGHLELIGEVVKSKPLISFVAGVRLEEMLKHIENPFRAMTNLGIEERGVVACYPPETAEHLRFLEADYIYCETEDELDAMTSYLGSSPALIAKLFNAFVISALHQGISYNHALKAGISAFQSAAYLYSKYGLEKTIRKIATPGGTTAEGLRQIAGIEKGFIDALISASRRVDEL